MAHSTAARLSRKPNPAAVLRSVWDEASDALDDVEAGRACFASLVEALKGIAERTAEALADVTRVEHPC